MTMSLMLEYFDNLLVTSEDVEQLNQAILQFAVQGKLVLQNPNDEPAISLLKQINEKYEEESHDKDDDLPDGWSQCTFSNVADVLRGVTYEKSQAQKIPEIGFLPILRANNIGNGLNFDDLVYVPVHFIGAEQKLREQDIVVCMSSGSATLVGKAAILRHPFDGSFGAFCAVLRSKINVTAEYLNLYLQSPQCRQLFTKTGRGIGINNLRVSDLLNSPLYLPPLAEQQRIIARVEELFVQTRALAKELEHSQIELDGLNKSALSHLLASETPKEFNQRWEFIAEHFDLLFQTPEHVAPLRQSILELAVRGKLTRREAEDESAKELLNKIKEEKDQKLQSGELRYVKEHGDSLDALPFEIRPEWAWCMAQDLFYVQSGNAFKSQDFTTRGIRLVRNVNIGHGSLTWNDTAFIPIEQEKDYEKFKLNQGDILISLDRPLITTGLKVAQVSVDDLPSLLVQRVGRVVFWSNHITPRYIYFWFLTSLFMDSIDPGRSKGIPHISQNDITLVSANVAQEQG